MNNHHDIEQAFGPNYKEVIDFMMLNLLSFNAWEPPHMPEGVKNAILHARKVHGSHMVGQLAYLMACKHRTNEATVCFEFACLAVSLRDRIDPTVYEAALKGFQRPA